MTFKLAGLGVDALSMAACIWYAALLTRGMDVNFDQLSYHSLYPWLLLHGGVGQVDPEPFANRYVNPLPELPWFLIDATFSPRVTAAFMGLLAGFNLPLVRRITTVCLPEGTSNGHRLILGSLSVLTAGTGVIFSMSLGTSLGDVLVSIPALGALLVLLTVARRGVGEPVALWQFAVAGLLAGIAVGMKLTMAPIAVGLGVVAMILSWRGRSIRPIGIFALGGCFGVALSAGWWYLQVWSATGNPIFPYFNGIFHSPLWNSGNFRDERFGAGSIGDLLAFPLYMWQGSRRLLDYEIQDPRWLVLSGLVAIALLLVVIRCMRGRREHHNVQVPAVGMLAAFFVISGLVWAFQFGIARYAVVLELLTGTLFVLVLKYVLFREWMVAGVGLALAASMLPFTRGTVEHVPFARDRYGIDAAPLRHLPAGSEVLVNAYSAPSGFLLPKLGDGVRRHVIHGWFYGSPLLEKLKDEELSKSKSIYVIQRDDWRRQKERVEEFQKAVGVRILPGTCLSLKSTVRDRVLCRAEWSNE